ncbi:polyadenylate-binding protein-interacting protein 2B-like [Lineus longissimus]|uniref:polyadenylate-binding protein-interacting protein 2B-like n=1 Tax=Lineus longissimus TaxID=88925 RepID=UPI002B4E9AC0
MKGPVDYGHKPDGRGDGGSHYNNNHPYHQPQGHGEGNEFAEFLWMGEENIEEFDKQCELEFWEEQFIESCFEEMLQEEQGQGAAPGNAGGQPQRQGQDSHSVFIPPQQNAPGPNILAAPSRVPNNNSQPLPRQVPPREGADLAGMMQGLNIEEHNQKNRVMSSRLNPDAPVFVPRSGDIRSSADR